MACLEKKALGEAGLRHLQAVEETQLRLQRELSEAARYVRSILPEPIDQPFVIDWKYHPSSEIGGDAFGYHWIDDEHFAIYLLDVCGHGVAASLLSATAINMIRSGAIFATPPPCSPRSTRRSPWSARTECISRFGMAFSTRQAARCATPAAATRRLCCLREPSPNASTRPE
jgi:hypothetical protein